MKKNVLFVIIIALIQSQLLSISFDKLAADRKLSQIDQYLIVTALNKSGENRSELLTALSTASDKNLPALLFLIKFMPERDLKSLTAKFLTENVQLAIKARNQFSWCKQLSQDRFFNDVLPYVVLNERRDNWREDFYNRFAPKVKDCKTVHEAIKIVNSSIKDELKVKYSTKRKKADQSPYESMESGLASCSCLSILLVDAFRSVGIPARVAGVPRWYGKPGNHSWVEVFVDSKWQFTEYYPDQKGLDHSWFVNDAGNAKDEWLFRVYASSFSPTEFWFPLVWDFNLRFVHAENVTDRYVKLAKDRGFKPNSKKVAFRLFDSNKNRVAKHIKVFDDTKVVFEGKTKGSLDDLNNVLLTDKLKVGKVYSVIYGKKEKKFTVNNDAKVQFIELY